MDEHFDDVHVDEQLTFVRSRVWLSTVKCSHNNHMSHTRNLRSNEKNCNNIIIIDDPEYDFKTRLQTEKLTSDLGLKTETSKFLQKRHTSIDIIKFLSDNEAALTSACWLYPIAETDNFDIINDDGTIIKLDWFDEEKPIYKIGGYFYVIFTAEEGGSLDEGNLLLLLLLIILLCSCVLSLTSLR